MSDWREVLWFGVMWAMVMTAVIWLTGCTTAGVSQEQQMASAAKGCYTHAVKCDAVTTASGIAAQAAASEAEVAVQLPRRGAAQLPSGGAAQLPSNN